MPPSPDSLLKTVFGYDTFRPLQREVINNVLHKRDTLGIMPTGGGKSLCYQLPALIFPGLTVVVSPLISLMKDQVEQLSEVGVHALFLNSSLSFEEYQENMNRVRSQGVKLLYVAPETLLTPRLLGLLSSVQVDCLTIDEAHCISEWGHDFRPEYRQIAEMRKQLRHAVCLALTATATPRVRADIRSSLEFNEQNEFIASFNRTNLMIEVAPKVEPYQQAIKFIQRFPEQSGIVYCFSRRQVDELAAALHNHGFSVLPYHAGLTDEERKRNQELFIRDDVQIIVATIAFGMGINKPNVRFILHYDLPKSIESYYQEIGRAGRDGLTSHCLLLYSYSDVHKLKYFLKEKEGPERQVAEQHLAAMVKYAESDICRRTPLLDYFGEKFTTENCGMCDNCLTTKVEQQIDLTIPAQKFMSCIKRTGERFGALHIVDVLLGSENQKVLKFGHNTLSTYGIGTDLTRKQWLHLSRQLIQKGYVMQEDKYGGLVLTPKAYDVFKGHETVWGKLQEEAQPGAESTEPAEEYNKPLFDLLRKKRKELADEAGIPPYIIFSDKTLVELSTYFPRSEASMKKMYGVGTVKFERYGQIFLELIASYCQEHDLVERAKQRVRRSDQENGRSENGGAAAGQMELKARYQTVGEAHNEGASIQELMERFTVQQSTILENISRYVQDGNSLNSEDELLALVNLPPESRNAVLAAYDKLGAERLKPVFEELNGAVNYDDLKILRIVYLSRYYRRET